MERQGQTISLSSLSVEEQLAALRAEVAELRNLIEKIQEPRAYQSGRYNWRPWTPPQEGTAVIHGIK